MINNIIRSLVSTNMFENNIYMKKYYDLINFNTDSYSADYTEKHHIIPVCYYKFKFKAKTRKQAEKFADADPNNAKVKLSYQNHVLAHFYLCQCCIHKNIKARLVAAFLSLINFNGSYLSLLTKTDQEILALATSNFKTFCKGCFGKPVICIETNTEYVNIAEANEAMGKDKYKYLGINNVCNHRDNQQTACGYHWSFKDDFKTLKALQIYLNTNNIVKQKNSSKKLYCVELSLLFNSASEAGKYFKSERWKILECCKKWWKTVNGYHFCYEEDLQNFKIIQKPKRTSEQRKFISIKTKEGMNRIPADLRKIQIEKSKNYWKQNDLHYYNNGISEIRSVECPDGWISGRLPKYKTKGILIKCVELDKTFQSCVEASLCLNINRKSISNCINGKAKTAGGYHWQKV